MVTFDPESYDQTFLEAVFVIFGLVFMKSRKLSGLHRENKRLDLHHWIYYRTISPNFHQIGIEKGLWGTLIGCELTTFDLSNLFTSNKPISWKCPLYFNSFHYSFGIYLIKANNKNIRAMCEICSNLTVTSSVI